MEYPNKAPQNPLISVCVTTYNHAPFIGQCIEGILAQEIKCPLELIIGEDDSTDGTREICLQYAKKYPDKIRLFLRGEDKKIWVNGRKTGNYNWLQNLLEARGQYVALCDGDDYWTDSRKLSKQLEVLENSSFILCATNARSYHEDTGEYKDVLFHFPNRQEFSHNAIATRNPFPTSTILFKNILKHYPEWFTSTPHMDWPFLYSISKYGKCVFLDEVTAIYRVHKTGFWSETSYFERIVSKMLIRDYFIKDTTDLSLRKKLLSEQLTDAKKRFRFKKSPSELGLLLRTFLNWLALLPK
jgi:glycosyltransferase involved in cell wall biosynthesis